MSVTHQVSRNCNLGKLYGWDTRMTQIFNYSNIQIFKYSICKRKKNIWLWPYQVSGNCAPDEIAKYLHLHKLQVSLTTYVESDLIDIDGILMVGGDDIKLQPNLILKIITSLYSFSLFYIAFVAIDPELHDRLYHKYKSFLSLC